ncbi:DUF2145 domain-containing protein [Ramlibacter albus]|uniref:DUF2145 domain-containing protein n=1 Tax=Ramlibacter albus TaxID=2079448 RepID=A0A923M6C3_9BURK|nr:DUF2145 domain-containing protein [Ramlibacter albus]MBC5763529.1 DUF2145 domain-containing protein [Ramlibacter albus]
MRALLLASALACAFAAPAHAGRSCEPRKASAETIARGITLAERTHAALEQQHAASGTQVVLLARTGQDLTKYGLRYSHMGIAYRTSGTDGSPAWRVLHKLNHCGTADAAIYRQGLAEFFLDDLWRYEAAWVTPPREMQAQVLALVADTPRSLQLHRKPYSIVSYAWGQRYQQSNQWAIETLAAAAEPTIATREQAQAWLRFKGYEPGVLVLGPLTRLGGRMGSANVAFDDHPNEKRFSDRIETVTVDSVFAWLRRAQLGGEPTVVRL